LCNRQFYSKGAKVLRKVRKDKKWFFLSKRPNWIFGGRRGFLAALKMAVG
jgi:hypothetical protein